MPTTNTEKACPNLDQYQQLASGQLSDPKKESILAHLENCEPCAQKLKTLPEQDTLVGMLRKADTIHEETAKKAIAGLVERLSKMRPEQVPAGAKPLVTAAGAAKSDNTIDQPPADVAKQATYDFLAPAQAPDELGRLGPYRVLEVLGSGGMGVVFRAEDPQLARMVALKAMLPGSTTSESARQRFLREARAAAAIKHDHIVSIYQVGADRGVLYLAMELLDGEPLDVRLQREGKLPVVEVLRLGRQIALALAAAHKRGLIHRDIKPANIWLEAETRRVKILDFGLARETGAQAQLTQQGAIVGTPAYMAPEQAKGKDVDHRCDLFSLGCVLYRMATGEAPFHGTDVVSTLMAVATETPRAPHVLNAGLPKELSALILRLLAKDPSERPASAQEVVQTLQTLECDWEREQAERTKSAAALRPAPRGRCREAAVVAALLALVAVAVVGVIRISTPEGDYVIQTDDPHFSFSVSKGGVTLRDSKTEREYALKVLRQDNGVFELDITDVGAGLSFKTKELTIKRGQTVALKAHFERRGAPGASATGVNPQKFTNSLGMHFAVIPKGKAWLDGAGMAGTRVVEFEEDFYLGVYEVTNEEWESVMGAGTSPSHFKRNGLDKKSVAWVTDEDLRRFPVEGVTWLDCQRFIAKLNAKTQETGWTYALPTQDQWEYACRGGPMRGPLEGAFNFYFDKPALEAQTDQANFDHPTALRRPCKVGSYLPNRLGLHDMHGNVFEWCAELSVNGDDSKRVVRGGSWGWATIGCRAVSRFVNPPNHLLHHIGMRVARVRIAADPDRRAAEWVLSIGGKAVLNDQDRFSAPIAELPKEPFRLTSVSFQQNERVTDAGLAHFQGCKNLTNLHLGGTKVTDTGLVHFKDCKNLIYLTLGYTAVTDAGLVHFKDCKNLIALDVGGTKATDAGLAYFKDCPSLAQLHLYSIRVSDAGLAHLHDCKNMTFVNLHATDVTDAGLERLAGLSKLSSVNVKNTKVTDAGVKKLSAALPKCKIESDHATFGPSAVGPRFTNSLGMEFALIPKGKAWLGGGNGKQGDKELEFKDDFYLGVYEVTQEEWEKLMETNPSHFARKGVHKGQVRDVADADLKRFPVDNISWHDAQAFLTALNAQDKDSGWVYRLPTEGEWEYACRGGPATDQGDHGFDFYLDKPSNQLLPAQANHNHVLKRTCKVGSYAPNRLGLYDMHGNIIEWCDDEVMGSDGVSRRMLRGGHWYDSAVSCRALLRNPHAPDSRKNGFGLRVARVRVAADADRRVAVWVLSVGGMVTRPALQVGKSIAIKRVEDLPLNLTDLSGITLSGRDVKDFDESALDKLRDLTGTVEVLSMTRLPIKDSGVERLSQIAGLRNLRVLNLNDTKITDAGLAHLTRLPKLETLFLENCPVGGGGLKHVRHMPQLKTLSLNKAAISDAGLAELHSKTLEGLELAWVKGISDAGLVHLSQLKQLKKLLLKQTNVSAAGVKKLAAALPCCRIDWDGGVIEPSRITNSLGMLFALIPKGKAWRGGGGQAGVREVEFKEDFYLGVYEVTQEEWQQVMGVNPSEFARAGKDKDKVAKISDADLKRFPVTHITWNDCQEFVVRLNDKVKESGWTYRLPTADEWQYACRGGPMANQADSGFDFYVDRPTNTLLPDRANFNNLIGRPTKVGSYPPTPLGLYDMHGNMGEWCEDVVPDGKWGMQSRATKGGGFSHPSDWCRAFYGVTCPQWGRFHDIGVRLVRAQRK